VLMEYDFSRNEWSSDSDKLLMALGNIQMLHYASRVRIPSCY
jgi:hypothetical protein